MTQGNVFDITNFLFYIKIKVIITEDILNKYLC